MILQLAPDSPPLLRAAATSILVLHIGAGGVGLVSGATALTARKGGRPHRVSGDIFVVSMLIMAAIGASVSPFLPQRSNVVPGILTCYLVATGWMTARRAGAQVGRFDTVAALVALVGAAIGLMFGLRAAASPTGLLDAEEPSTYYLFAGITALAGVLDLSVIVRGGVAGAARLARHIWRMSLGMLIATTSLFIGQPKVFPAGLRGAPIMFAPEIIVLGLMIFWLIRVRAGRRFKASPTPGQGVAA